MSSIRLLCEAKPIASMTVTDSQANFMRMRVTSWRTMAEDWIAGGVGSLMNDIEAGKSVEYVCW